MMDLLRRVLTNPIALIVLAVLITSYGVFNVMNGYLFYAIIDMVCGIVFAVCAYIHWSLGKDRW